MGGISHEGIGWGNDGPVYGASLQVCKDRCLLTRYIAL